MHFNNVASDGSEGSREGYDNVFIVNQAVHKWVRAG